MSAIRPRQHRNRNERAHKQQIQQHPHPPQPARTAALQRQGHDGSEEGVKDSSSEDTLDSSGGSIHAAAGLDGVDEPVDFVDARGEDGEGGSRGRELERADEAEEPAVEEGIFKCVGHETRQETGLVVFVDRGGGGAHGVGFGVGRFDGLLIKWETMD